MSQKSLYLPAVFYYQELKLVKGITFTEREIDVIACVLSGKSTSTISVYLNISSKTVETHIRNITSKLGCNSREKIIHFIEQNRAFEVFHQHYQHLLLDHAFLCQLQKISKLLRGQEITCEIAIEEEIENKAWFSKHLTSNLNHAGITVTLKSFEEKSNIILATSEHLLSKEHQNNTINLNLQENFYELVFAILNKIITHHNLNNINDEFQMQYMTFKKGLDPVCLENSIETVNNKRHFKCLTIITPIALIIGIAIYIFDIQSKNIDSSTQILKVKLIEPLKQTFKGLSVSNLEKKEADQNYNIIQQFSEAVKQISSDQIQTYWNSNELQPTELVNCLYNLNATASYLLFKEYDAENAEKILKYAKSMAEDYASSKSSLILNFDNKNAEEVNTELAIIKDLPEMYTSTIYFLGRSAVYQGDIESAKKYFTLSRNLGKELGLFEEVLSVRNGLWLIDRKQIDINIINGNYKQAKKDLIECIDTYKKIRQDDREYKIKYQSDNQNTEIIIPKKDIYNVVDCSRRITDLYTKLIGITDNKNENIGYLEEVSRQYIGTDTLTGALEILTKSNRIAPDSYNSLGFFLLKLYEKDIDFKEFKNNLVKSLNLIDGNKLEIICKLFEKAKSLSREVEFTRADAFDGLAKVHKRFNHIAITEEEKKQLSLKIQGFKEERDKINQRLKRFFPR